MAVNSRNWKRRTTRMKRRLDGALGEGVKKAVDILGKETSANWKQIETGDVGRRGRRQAGITLSRQDSRKPKFQRQRDPVRKKRQRGGLRGTVRVQSFLAVTKGPRGQRTANAVARAGGERTLYRKSLVISRPIFGGRGRQAPARISLRKRWLMAWAQPINQHRKYAVRLGKKLYRARHALTLAPALKSTSGQVAAVLRAAALRSLTSL